MVYETRILTSADQPMLDDFLRPHSAQAYYMRSNMYATGIDYHGQAYGGVYIAAFQNGKLAGAIMYSWINTILIFAPDTGCLPALAKALEPIVIERGGIIDSVLGVADHVSVMMDSMRITPDVPRRDAMEGLFALKADALCLPAGSAATRLASEKDRDQLIDWRIAYNIETMNAAPGPALEQRVKDEIDRRFKVGDMYVLEDGQGHLVSFCGAGGATPESIIIGPVWTPPSHRSQGYGRAVTAGAIDLVRKARPDLKDVFLFTATPAAEKAYRAIGFQRIDDWRMVLMKETIRFPL